jgi:hypothetical protein
MWYYVCFKSGAFVLKGSRAVAGNNASPAFFRLNHAGKYEFSCPDQVG